tara:strand:- start:106441 stop:107823 length:1383 start_codon:yes stop_codon:yes gene_type:complete
MQIYLTILYLSYAVAGSALFLVWRRSLRAAAYIYVAGLIFLPVGLYPRLAPTQFPYWIVGSAWPSDMLVQKGWIVPLVVLAGALVFGYRAYRSFRVTTWDAALLGWCLWPLCQSLMRPYAAPAGWVASLYLLGSWGAPWLLGRMFFGSSEGRRELLHALVMVTLVLLPIAVIEGAIGPSVYSWLWHRPPFADDGSLRYIGFRPLAMFENGNQYGIWLACASLAAIGMTMRGDDKNIRFYRVSAFILCAMTLAAQSIGAIVLLGMGAILLKFRVLRTGLRKVLVPCAIAALLGAGLYGSGALRVETVSHWGPAQQIVGILKSVGRQSLSWRVMEDQKALPLIARSPIIGSGRWDWWRPLSSRPWGSPLLVIGHYGLIGFLLMGCALVGPIIAAVFKPHSHRREDRYVLILLIVALVAIGDALLNSFLFLPLIAISASLVSGSESGRGARARSRGAPYKRAG